MTCGRNVDCKSVKFVLETFHHFCQFLILKNGVFYLLQNLITDKISLTLCSEAASNTTALGRRERDILMRWWWDAWKLPHRFLFTFISLFSPPYLSFILSNLPIHNAPSFPFCPLTCFFPPFLICTSIACCCFPASSTLSCHLLCFCPWLSYAHKLLSEIQSGCLH